MKKQYFLSNAQIAQYYNVSYRQGCNIKQKIKRSTKQRFTKVSICELAVFAAISEQQLIINMKSRKIIKKGALIL